MAHTMLASRNLECRIFEHQQGLGAKYTSHRLPVNLVYGEEYDSIADAYAREKQVQGWRRAKREALINGNPELLPQTLPRKFLNKVKFNKDNTVVE